MEKQEVMKIIKEYLEKEMDVCVNIGTGTSEGFVEVTVSINLGDETLCSSSECAYLNLP